MVDQTVHPSGLPKISRAQFVAMMRGAVEQGQGFAAGKMGGSERNILLFPTLDHDRREGRRAIDVMMGFHGKVQTGLFPRDGDFYREFAGFYAQQVRQLDTLGLFGWAGESRALKHYGFTFPLTYFSDQEPDRSIPEAADICYLPAFAGKKLLLISPFAPLLVERANKACFEAVWAKTGKQWFAPAQVKGITMPYGWAPETKERYGTSLALYSEFEQQMAEVDFDVALIAAGALGIPLACCAKRMGKAAISLGGHLQVLFGVAGKRWRDQAEWRDNYFTDAWIDVPPDYRPTQARLADGGAYW